MSAITLDRSDATSIEAVASEVCNATFGKWRVCEVWREGRGKPDVACRRAPSRDDGASILSENAPDGLCWTRGACEDTPPEAAAATTTLSLAFGAGPKRGCFSPMRAPRSHACARCLDDPIAKMLRTACSLTFSPGIGLVGRAWLLGRAEIVDLASGQWPATYARPEAAERARMATVIAIPLVLDDGVRAPTAVVVVSFGVRLAVPGVKPPRTLAEDLLDAMLARGRAAAERLRAPPRRVMPLGRSVTPTKPTKLADADREYAKKLAGHARDRMCPVCHGPLDRAVVVEACRHAACSECMARWALTSPACPVCRCVVDAVVRDASLDAAPVHSPRTVSL